ncbi:MAG: bifunctional [glutamate--ammonia ligase]-adenylyl-L-tyrosine phosphorylase/[glutamate--ammonia-ligase] adenylyltransferase [Pseudomonadota bacterium]
MPTMDYIAALPEILRTPASLWAERVNSNDLDANETLAQQTVHVVACSEFAARVIAHNWRWFLDNAGSFDAPPDGRDLDSMVDEVSALSADKAKTHLRRFRNRFMLRVLWRDLHGLASLDETLQQLSELAERSLDAATSVALRELDDRYGRVRTAAGEEVPIIVLGMGKLGGRELNFSSDIDLIFCYLEDGESDGARATHAQDYFGRLARKIIALLDERTTDGFVFRIDTRLRPFGDSGPPVVSFTALESYLLQHGRDWERYAYVKARIVGRQPPAHIADELHNDLIQPFVYRRYLDYGVFESLRNMQAMIAAEVKRRELADNVKLGPGGIREAEFVVQALQLVRGGSEPELQSRQLQAVLPRLVRSRGLTAEGADALLAAYRFLRRVENCIQAIRDEQTHDLPGDEADRARLCLALGIADWDRLTARLDEHRAAVSQQFKAIAFQGAGDSAGVSGVFSSLWETDATAATWQAALAESDADDAPEIAAAIVSFAESKAMQQTDATARERLQLFMPRLVERIVDADRPLSALRRCLAVTEQVLRRSSYIALLNESDTAMSRFVDLCERSSYIADQLARHPVLLDELLDPRAFSEAVTKDDLVRDLAERIADETDSETRMRLTAQFQRATMFRIAVADFNGELPIMKVSDGLTWLAEVVLDEALRVAWRDLADRHGAPTAGFGIVGYGKLGGLELSYGSDLDIVFLHNASGNTATTAGDRPLEYSMFFARLVRRLMHFLTTQTGSGELYEIDTRLRPDGRSGLLVSGLDGFEKYQEDNAWTWEHQALLRARPVAGDPAIAESFERIRRETLATRVRRDALRDDVMSMKKRMRKELDQSRDGRFDLKHGAGGIGDIEFLVQYLVLRSAGDHESVIEYSDNIRQLDALIKCDVVDAALGRQLQDIYRAYRVRLHHLALDDQPAVTSDTEFVAERQAVSEAWQRWLA